MHRYVESARRLWPLLALVLGLVWLPGLIAAYTEYVTTFESAATVWVERASTQYSVGGANDPSLGAHVSPGPEQAEVFTQLLQTNSFLEEVVNVTSLRSIFAAVLDREKFFGEIRKRFKAQALGTNLVRVSYRANEPGIAAEMVSAALAARESRVKAARIAATTASITFYQREYEIAQKQSLTSQRELDSFNATHTGRLSSGDEYQQNQLRLAVEVALGRLSDLRQRLERGAVSTALLDLAESINFQVIDRPRAEPYPSGGTRGATLVGGVALAGGFVLFVIIVAVSALLNDKVDGIEDVRELLAAGPFGIVPKVATTANLSATLAAGSFLPATPSSASERRTA
jgi:uncharacterized protein involved in exopolysaccharide biosynthesis